MMIYINTETTIATMHVIPLESKIIYSNKTSVHISNLYLLYDMYLFQSYIHNELLN